MRGWQTEMYYGMLYFYRPDGKVAFCYRLRKDEYQDFSKRDIMRLIVQHGQI